MISIEDAIIAAGYYMIFGCVVSTYCRRLVKFQGNFKEDLACTSVVIIWPLIVIACLFWVTQGVFKAFRKYLP